LHLGLVDHGRLHQVSNFGTVAQFRLFCKCSCNLWSMLYFPYPPPIARGCSS
jgi:hypothetical protein